MKRDLLLASVLLAAQWSQPHSAAAKKSDAVQGLLRHENARITELTRAAGQRSSAVLPAPPLPPSARPGSPYVDKARREIDVTTAEQLTAALGSARPGDCIRLADGVYRGRFAASVSGTKEAPIVLVGSRGAVLESGSIGTAYGLWLRADHWTLAGFSIRNSRKGLMMDRVHHALVTGLEISEIGEEGIHLRSFSTDNRIEGCWIHDVGRLTPKFGEGIYIGSAVSHWDEFAGGAPDACDRNRVVGNLIGPGVQAEGVDAKEGTTGGSIENNAFLFSGASVADSWIDLKGNGYSVRGNRGILPRGGRDPVAIHEIVPGWGKDHTIRNNQATNPTVADEPAFRAVFRKGAATIVLPRRALPYTFSELMIRFPASFLSMGSGVVFVHDHVLVGPGAELAIDHRQVREIRLASQPRGFASIASNNGVIRLSGSAKTPLRIGSWDPTKGAPDSKLEDGRAYISAVSSVMELDRVETTDLGFGTGWTSGVAWKGRHGAISRGHSIDSRYERNYFGAYTFECRGMHWMGNVFANNIGYGFDPHDHSDDFVVIGNEAKSNGHHGIIFSRGCVGNVLRRNRSHDNHGHGIMMDDGKVADDGDPRHRFAVPSNLNRIEENEVWNNEVGIAFEGGRDNIVRANRIHDNQYGIRLEGDASSNEIVGNEIRASSEFAIYIYNRSNQNRVVENRIDGGQGGVVVRNSAGNVIDRNVITGIDGRGIVLSGNVTGSDVQLNRIVGRGSRAIDLASANGIAPQELDRNQTRRWLPPRAVPLAATVWGTILVVPVVSSIPARWLRGRRKRRTP